MYFLKMKINYSLSQIFKKIKHDPLTVYISFSDYLKMCGRGLEKI